MKIAISMGDMNGVSAQIALKAHNKIKKLCTPIYITNQKVFENSAKLLNLKIPKDMKIYNIDGDFRIKAGKISKKSVSLSKVSFF